ncbi:MAG: proton-conducting transporter membrane subunit [Xanthobacteraceae bacterium]
MPNELIAAAFFLWIAAAAVALLGRGLVISRLFLAAGGAVAIVAGLLALPGGTAAYVLPAQVTGEPIVFQLQPEALWLMGFGLAPAIVATVLATPGKGKAGWLFGAAASLVGALGVFGLQGGAAFLIAWEIMSFGGAVMILAERTSAETGRPVLFMLALLEIGTVALLVAILILAVAGGGFTFAGFAKAAAGLPTALQALVGVLLLIGFGAKLGLLPFYEWFPSAYSAGSGASGALLSGVILNAAFFGLSRACTIWMPGTAFWLGVLVVVVGILSAILTVLYAFQQEDWRSLLSFSSAENAAIAVAALGAALMFRAGGLANLAGLSWTVALLHLAGHALAKGGLFLAADGVFQATGKYAIAHTDLLRRSAWPFGIGALFAAMSLAAMPPQAGFVSEWYLFQTLFQGFHLSGLGGRLVLALAGAGLALTAAIALATFVKVLGLGLLGRSTARISVPAGSAVAVGLMGAGVLALAVGMPYWLHSLSVAASREFASSAPALMHVGLVLVPATGAPIALTKTFSFISPTLLVIVMPLLAIIPCTMLLASRRFAVRRAAVWYGGLDHDPQRASTTALTFANALRTFYSFVYRPSMETKRDSNGRSYFIRRLTFSHDVAPVFGPCLFAPATRLVLSISNRLRLLQSGQLNFYLALIGALLVVILALALT